LTEKSIQLYHFDRSGCVYTSTIDIHEDAPLFVATILEISSMDAQTLGYDTSIYWEGEKRLLRTVDAYGEAITYEICNGKPQFLRHSIRSRGTCCWKVRDANGNYFLIKESWRSRNRIAEIEFLKAAKGLRGVGQMIAYEEGENISDLRRVSDAGFRDRAWSRVTLELYGRPISEFNSRQELLVAFRDAVAGEMILLYILSTS
jgi:Fungal protein kinase